ncbi:MAG: SlyX family protein [Pelomonas sp.]|nr:SlyX family protein [Roseateles sp.]MBV8470563.1 SlyX family protein [Burkholderiaceae bacterium]MBV8604585.1 SlyX family protein [Roseateles sp.]
MDAQHPPETRLEQRITELEIKASFSEDLLDHLNQIIARQQQQIDALIRELSQLRERSEDGGAAPFKSLRDELPPHY